MTLLDTITTAAAAASTTTTTSPFPVILTPNTAAATTTTSSTSTTSFLTPLPNWQLGPTDSTLTTSAQTLTRTLTKNLQNPIDLLIPLAAFLRSLAETLSRPLVVTSDPASIVAAINNFAGSIPPSVAILIADAAISFNLYEILDALIQSRLLAHPGQSNLIEKLCSKNQSWLICQLARAATDLRSSELLAALKFFLSPSSEEAYDSMMEVKKSWASAAVSTVERLKRKGWPKKDLKLAKEAAVLLMMGHDEFSSPEVCLHYVFASESADGIVMASAVARLDGAEVAALVGYLVKWVRKYERFPEARLCPEASKKLGLDECQSVPSFGVVVQALGLVLDEHFSYLVLNAEVREELRAAEKVVGSLAAEAELCCPVVEVVGQLKSEASREKGM